MTTNIKVLLPIASIALTLGCSAKAPTHAELQEQIDKLVFVEGGTFQMGDVGYTDKNGQHRNFTGRATSFPVHPVTLSSYSIQAYEVTFAEFDHYSRFIGEEIVGANKRHRKHAQPNYPAQWMTWHQARGYCQWLGNRLGYSMDLSTEAQWEYAARSRGKAVAYATNDGIKEWGRNIRDARQGEFEMPVGSWPPNPLGLYDMTGNVNEWTVDLWHPYFKKPLTDPNFNNEETAQYTSQRMLRGGGLLITLLFMIVK